MGHASLRSPCQLCYDCPAQLAATCTALTGLVHYVHGSCLEVEHRHMYETDRTPSISAQCVSQPQSRSRFSSRSNSTGEGSTGEWSAWVHGAAAADALT